MRWIAIESPIFPDYFSDFYDKSRFYARFNRLFTDILYYFIGSFGDTDLDFFFNLIPVFLLSGLSDRPICPILS